MDCPFTHYHKATGSPGCPWAPSHLWSEALAQVLQGLKWGDNVAFYADDVYVFTETFEEHLAVMEEVLSRIEDSGLKLNLKKTQWSPKSTTILGFN